MIELLSNSHKRLSKIVSLLDAFHKKDISYCHIGKITNLQASLSGATDLDILFCKKQKKKIETILRNLEFKLFYAVKEKQYKDIHDFLGLDVESGKVIHLHTHFILPLGKPYLKEYHIDIEEEILNSRIFNEEFNIYQVNPNFKLILLFITESLKLRNRDLLLKFFKNRTLSDRLILEYYSLKKSVIDPEIKSFLKVIFHDYQKIFNLIIKEFNPENLEILSPLIKERLPKNRLNRPIENLFLRWFKEAKLLFLKVLNKYFSFPVVIKRINPRGGVSVALIGADGSGKSTISQKLKESFEEKLDVYSIYFGRGDGKKSISRKILNYIKKLLVPNRKINSKNNKENTGWSKDNFLRDMYKCMNAILVAREKRINIIRMKSARKKGMLVICDRFPQNQIMGYNDGPILHSFLKSRNFIYRKFAKMEKRDYEIAENNPPDIIFKLITLPEVIEERKPEETSLERLLEKINGIKALKFKRECKVITIDAGLPLSQVLTKIKYGIWNSL